MSAKKTAKKKLPKPPAKKATKKTKDTPAYIYQTKNGATRPKPGGNTARVWEIADDMTEKTGATAVRKDVLAKVTKEKIPLATGATQYNLWRVFNGLSKAANKASKTKKPAAPAIKMPKVKLPKPPKKASGKIGLAKSPNLPNAAKGKKLPKPPAKKAAPAAPAPAPEAVVAAPATESAPAAS